MTTTSAPFGLRAVSHPSGTIRPNRMTNGIASGYATSLYQGTPVKLNSSGEIVISAGNDDILGVFWGCEYTVGGYRRQGYWPASTVPDTTGDPFYVFVYQDPVITYEIQGASTYAVTAIGDQADFSNITAGSTTTGYSQATLGTLVGAGAQGQFRITGLCLMPNNAWGDTYTIVQGQIARQQYVAVKVAI